MSFELDPRLNKDSVYIANLGIFQLRLHKDARYPWLILVPEVANVSELHHLSFEHQQAFLQASGICSAILETCFSPDKLNIACLGNIVKQLHIHHVARFKYDDTWPGPIWGQGEPKPYSSEELANRLEMIKSALATHKDNI